MTSQNSTSRIFIITIALLLIANLVTLSLLFTSKKTNETTNNNDDRKNILRNYLKQEVGFTDAQLVQYDTLKSKQRSQVKLMYDSMRMMKQQNIKRIGNTAFNDSAILSAASATAIEQERIEITMLQNLKAIRAICTPTQQQVFDTGIYKIMSKPAPDNKKKEK